MQIILIITLYGLLWGSFHFFGYKRMKNKVLANPESYSQFKVTFFRKLTPLPMAGLSFLTALFCPVAVTVVALIVYQLIRLFS